MPRTPTLRRLVEQHAVTPLVARGFIYSPDPKLPTFRRHRVLPGGSLIHIVEFQAGVKMGSFGTFTVNLGVYSPEWTYPPRHVKASDAHSWNCMAEMRQRLGHLAPPAPAGILARLLGSPSVPADRWWSYRGGTAALQTTFSEVVTLILSSGEAWFEELSTPKAFHTAKRVRGARVAGMRANSASSSVQRRDAGTRSKY